MTVGDRQNSVTEPEQKTLYPASGGAGEVAPQEIHTQEKTNYSLCGMSLQKFFGYICNKASFGISLYKTFSSN